MGQLLSSDSSTTASNATLSNDTKPTTVDPNDLWPLAGDTVGNNQTSEPPQTPLILSNGTLSNATDTIGPADGDYDDSEFSVNVFGTIIYPLRWFTLTSLASWLGPLSSLAMIIGCVLPYVPQYATIYKERSCSGFSTYVCLTLLIANILRIAFWFGHRFELPLLIQSIIMIFAQILLLELCIRVKKLNAVNRNIRRNILSMNPKYFWRWTDLTSHLVFLITFAAILGIAVYYFIDNEPFIESLGYCALITESMLGVPQVIRNYRKRSVAGMSLSMVLMWLAGDSFKTGYFITNAVPYQFWLCGLLQMTIDIVILFQVCLFKQNAPIKMNSGWE